jgi:hypothetical protein
VTAHLSVSGAELRRSLDALVPRTGDGVFTVLGSSRAYKWTRDPLDVSFTSGRIVVKTYVASSVDSASTPTSTAIFTSSDTRSSRTTR